MTTETAEQPPGGWLGLADPGARQGSGPLPEQIAQSDVARLVGACIVVTGAGRGIGRAVAAALAEAGAHVLAVDLDVDALHETTAALVGMAGSVAGLPMDITDADAVRAALADVVGRHGRLDAVVNNAGVVHVDDILELPVETWQRVFRVNVEGTFVVAQAAARLMVRQEVHPALRRRGLLLNVSSGAAKVGRPHLAAYGASKAAVDHLTRSLDAAVVDRGVAAVTIYPGNIREGMWGHLGARLAEVQGRPRDEVESEREFQSVDEFASIARDVIAIDGTALSGHTVDWQRRVLP